jgi:hypothetical protein
LLHVRILAHGVLAIPRRWAWGVLTAVESDSWTPMA